MWCSRLKLWLEIFYFMKIILFAYFWLFEDLFHFWITLDDQYTYFATIVTHGYLWSFYINTRSFNLIWCERRCFVWPFRPLWGIHGLVIFTILVLWEIVLSYMPSLIDYFLRHIALRSTLYSLITIVDYLFVATRGFSRLGFPR